MALMVSAKGSIVAIAVCTFTSAFGSAESPADLWQPKATATRQRTATRFIVWKESGCTIRRLQSQSTRLPGRQCIATECHAHCAALRALQEDLARPPGRR